MTEFRVLGEISVSVAGTRLPIRGARQQSVLAVLLAEANRPVPGDRLLDRAWGSHRLPARPANAVQSQLSLLRRALAPAPGVAITWQQTGYRLTVDEETVDLHRFRRLTGQARAAGDERQAGALLADALGLWQGEPFAALDVPWLADLRARLARERAEAQRDLADVLLRQGRHAELLPELVDQAAAHPWDERLAGQLMLALHRGGRPAEALDAYRRLRGRLAEDMGIEPGPALRELHQRMLAADPGLGPDPKPSGPVPPDPIPAGPVVPRQLPAPPRWFAGRERETGTLTGLLPAGDECGPAVAVAVLSGAGGIGKTWLALRWAHQHLDRFPDGQLYVDLRGFDPSGTPLASSRALHGFLSALGVAPAAIPAGLDARAGLYRSVIAGRRLLVVADNAASAEQVRPLLPGSPACAMLITSRHRLADLGTTHGAQALPLDALSDRDAEVLLAARLDAGRMAAEPGAVAEILACCAGLPLALGIVAGRARTHPGFPLAALAAELRHTRLNALEEDPASGVRAVLSWSHAALTAEQVRTFRLLGLVPGPDIDLLAAAALLDRDPAGTAPLLTALERASLLHQHAPGRFRMHDLVRLYAIERATGEDADAALRRLVDFYVHTAYTADRLLGSRTVWPSFEDGPVDSGRPVLADEESAMAWFAAEHECLLATQQAAVERSWHEPVWQFAWTTRIYHLGRGSQSDNLRTWRPGLAAADHLPDPFQRLRARLFLGHACQQAGLRPEAHRHLQDALAMARELDDPTQLGKTYVDLGFASECEHDYAQALEYASLALATFRAAGIVDQAPRALASMGWAHGRLGHYAEARACCREALTLLRRHPDKDYEADAWDALGYVLQHTGRPEPALRCYQRAVELLRVLGMDHYLAATLERVAETESGLGRRQRAEEALRRAEAIYRRQYYLDDAERVRRALGPAETVVPSGKISA